jgi:methionyl-tRNA synthetase
MKPAFYLTTAIDYVNGAPHLGHAYERITSDVIARWKRLAGYDVRFLTGTDEHGIKVQKAAEEAGLTPQAYTDSLVPQFEEAWRALDISYDRFIRTTDADHKATVTALLEAVRDAGWLKEKDYEGWYCEGCEAFKTDKDLVDGQCPDHPSREVSWIQETNLFFLLSQFGDQLLAHYEANPTFVEPASRRNEVLFLIKEGLNDLSISRSLESVSWGIPISFRPDSVIYVWFDALINYLTGAGYGTDDAMFERFWPADIHVLGKDVTRFHCIIWPAMLLAAGLPLPKKIFAHGWVLTGDARKLSKSDKTTTEGERDISPVGIATTYGPDAIRWFLTHEITFGRDGEFTWQRFEDVYNAHLANGLGNLLSRSVGMAVKYFGGVPAPVGPADALLHEVTSTAITDTSAAYEDLRLHDATSAAWRIITTCNEQVQAREPWKMAKDPDQKDALADFLYALMESLRIACVLLSPVMPRKTAACLEALGAHECLNHEVTEATQWGRLPVGDLERPTPLFPRLDQLLG